MKFKLKKLFGFALVILLIWTVYTIFFSKIIEANIDYNALCEAQTTAANCNAKQCFWSNPKPAEPAKTMNYMGRVINVAAKPAQPGKCRYK
jgi:hypothetical protein